MLFNSSPSPQPGRHFRLAAIAATAAIAMTVLTSAPVMAASFDCAKARSKLNRMICADAELSALDSQVWDFYGERIKTLSLAEHAHVRERHLIWRRQRGLFDNTVAEIKADYRQHFTWLSHPLLPLEGMYEHGDGHSITIEIDLTAADRLAVFGSVKGPEPLAWVARPADETAESDAPLADAQRARSVMVEKKQFAAVRAAPLEQALNENRICTIGLRFENDTISVTSIGPAKNLSCTLHSGDYRKAHPLPRF